MLILEVGKKQIAKMVTNSQRPEGADRTVQTPGDPGIPQTQRDIDSFRGSFFFLSHFLAAQQKDKVRAGTQREHLGITKAQNQFCFLTPLSNTTPFRTENPRPPEGPGKDAQFLGER